MKFWLGLCCCLVLLVSAIGEVKPKNGFVPEEATAVKIAEAVLIPVYGEKKIVSERPFVAKLEKDAWTVSGTLHCPNGGHNCDGGTAVVKISKTDGRILFMTHYM